MKLRLETYYYFLNLWDSDSEIEYFQCNCPYGINSPDLDGEVHLLGVL